MVSIWASPSNNFESFFVFVFDTAKVERLVVGLSTFPAVEDCPDPFKGERANRAGGGFSFAALALVIKLCPLRVTDRWAGEFVKSLTKELWGVMKDISTALPYENPEKILKTMIAWGRYAGLMDYDTNTKMVTRPEAEEAEEVQKTEVSS